MAGHGSASWLDAARAGTCVLALALLGCGCSKSQLLPTDPGLAHDDLGLGIRLGMSKSDALTAADNVAKQSQVLVLTREEFALVDPYAEQQKASRDVLIALYSGADEGPVSSSAAGVDSIDEVRCYLAEGEKSALKLLGRSAALLNAPQAEDLLGNPYSRDQGVDGQNHLTYYFGLPAPDEPDRQLTQQALKLVLSFNALGQCYAADLALTVPPGP